MSWVQQAVALMEQQMRQQLQVVPLPVIIQALERELMIAQAQQKAKATPRIALPNLRQ